MDDIFPRNWNRVTEMVDQNQTLLNEYYKYHFTSYNPRTCTDACKKDAICSLKSGSTDLYNQCMNG